MTVYKKTFSSQVTQPVPFYVDLQPFLQRLEVGGSFKRDAQSFEFFGK